MAKGKLDSTACNEWFREWLAKVKANVITRGLGARPAPASMTPTAEQVAAWRREEDGLRIADQREAQRRILERDRKAQRDALGKRKPPKEEA